MTSQQSADAALILVGHRPEQTESGGRVRRRRTEIVVELDEIFVIRGRRPMAAWCEECAGQVQMLTPDHAATIAGVSPRLIYRWIDAGRIHFSEAAEGGLFVCKSSLTKLNQREGNFDASIE